MRQLFTLVLTLYVVAGFGQAYNNEWIDPAKTYYKFRTNRTGLIRIPQSTLASYSLDLTPVQQFKMWRNGQEVPLYTSVQSGVLPGNGYIEFWSDANDGKPDKPLYRDPKFQHTDKNSLQTDSVVYFLTVDPVASNLRFTDAINNVAGNSLAPEPYFMYTAGNYFTDKINPGFASVLGTTYVYSSSYETGEQWSSSDISPASARTYSQANLFPYTAGPSASLKFGASGNALNGRSIQARLNGTLLADTICNFFNDVISTNNFPVSAINAGNADVQFNNTSGVTTDRMVVSFYEITYPRLFNFGAATNFSFQLPASSTGFFLQINNFNYNSTAPVLYDFTNHTRYTGDISTPGMVQFALPAGLVTRQLILVNQEAGNFLNLAPGNLIVKKFVDFTNTANQGNYLIISSPLLYSGPNNTNPINDYKAYRSSAAGGGYNVSITDIDELVDQFAFGIKKHPLSVKNFLRYARNKFSSPPQYAILIGHGVVYSDYRGNITDPLADRLNIIPSFGYPASDNLLSSNDALSPVALTPIGRISAVTAQEVADYLEKLKEYEAAQKSNPNTIADRAWMKNIMQVTGATDAYLGAVLCNYMDNYRQIISDTLAGANVFTFCKSSTNTVVQLSSDQIAQLFAQGLSMVTYFGHSSATILEFNIADPQTYNNPGKYPIFSVNGCNAGNFFAFDPQRFTYSETLSEKFTLAKQRGGIAFLASTHFGIVNYLNIFINYLYVMIGQKDYGATLGKIHIDATTSLLQTADPGDQYARLTAEEMTLHGDPALKFNFQPLPDYVIEAPQIRINPQFISISENKFNVGVTLYNIGKAVNDSVLIEIKQQYPNNSTVTVFRKKVAPIKSIDSLNIDIPIVATRDKGLNKITVTIDPDNLLSEITKANNSVTVQFYVYEDDIQPITPYDLSIVNTATVKLYASTANPFSTLRQYAMEMDTTASFNSPLKISKMVNSTGGLIEFDPGNVLLDSTVYYWRTASVPPTGGQYHWNTASFIYLPLEGPGYNQSHYFQHNQSSLVRISLGPDRIWKFDTLHNDMFLRNALFPTSGRTDNDFTVQVNGFNYFVSACVGHSLIFNVLDPISLKPWRNTGLSNNNLFLSGSSAANCSPGRLYNFEFQYLTAASRNLISRFMDSIPNGYYVVVRSFDYNDSASFSAIWKRDEIVNGPGNSIYTRLLNAGLTDIDSINAHKCWSMIYKKGDPLFTPSFKISVGLYDAMVIDRDLQTPDSLGYITSPVFGPARHWKQLHWRGKSLEANSADNPTVEVIGVTNTGVENVLYTLGIGQQDLDISSVNPVQYPFIKLSMRNIDSLTVTPWQLNYWRLDYDPVPEGALIPNIYFKTKNPTLPTDTLEIGESLQFGIGFKNISLTAFDSLKLKVYVLDRNNVQHLIPFAKNKPLIAGDSVKLDFTVDTKTYPGLNTLYIDFNPDNDQPEQFHFNNFMFRNFYVKPDVTNPLLDVTFDNVHILNRDIVSAKPHILIKLKDDAKFLLLNDTSGMTVQVRSLADNSTRSFQFGTDTLRFIPAVSGTNNTATIEFNPQFLKQINPDGDEYELIVTGKDISGNNSGVTAFKVIFRIISKPMISNLLNYPNPFTTSTAFVFTITGTDIPDNMKIQILTVTGKIVREITKQELGPLHIGRNITDYKWDGNDQYGQRLGNGVYLYRFVTTLNGKKLDKYSGDGDTTDKFFTQGYGKMYLMR